MGNSCDVHHPRARRGELITASQAVRVRFAPSPTGPLHIGGARTALFNALFARRHAGAFILRIDDTDEERSKPEFERDILEGLKWLGIDVHEGPIEGGAAGPYRQSERRELHLQTVAQLVEAGVAKKDRDGTTRLSYGTKAIEFHDLICGDCSFLPRSLGPDPVLLRADGVPTYHLASVSDDIQMGITHVIRGGDHLTNTAKHVRMYQALHRPLPKFAHLPLILGDDGHKLSKRDPNAPTMLSEFRRAGYIPEALVNFLILLGWSHPENFEQFSFGDAAKVFDLNRVSHTAATFDRARLNHLNGLWLRGMKLDELEIFAAQHLAEYSEVPSQIGQRRWREVLTELQEGFNSVQDILEVARIVGAEEIELPADAVQAVAEESSLDSVRAVAKEWRALLGEVAPSEGDDDAFSEGEIAQILSLLKKRCGAQGISGKALFRPLRLCVMSSASGPELKAVLRWISHRTLIVRADYVISHLM